MVHRQLSQSGFGQQCVSIGCTQGVGNAYTHCLFIVSGHLQQRFSSYCLLRENIVF